MKVDEYRDLVDKEKKPHKYRAKPEYVDGIRFASKREAGRYRDLKRFEGFGLISDIQLQPKFPLGTDEAPVLIKSAGYPNGRRAAYFADFKYWNNGTSLEVIEDVKGIDTPLSRLKRAIVEAQYSIEIVLI